MGFIDTHAHLYEAEFAEDEVAMMQRAREAGADKLFLPNINAETVEPMLGMCRRYPGFCYPMMGLHPTDVKDGYESVLEDMEGCLLGNHPFIGIGEVGLDYYWSKDFYAEQQEAFRWQMEWAVRYDLPLMIHCRNAHKELLALMGAHHGQPLRGVFHCFSGTFDEAKDLLAYDGFMLGVGGVLTYKKSVLPETLRGVPLTRIVLETDAPYLAPVPYRGRRNESAYLTQVVERLSALYGVSVEEVERVTSANALQVFPRAL